MLMLRATAVYFRKNVKRISQYAPVRALSEETHVELWAILLVVVCKKYIHFD